MRTTRHPVAICTGPSSTVAAPGVFLALRTSLTKRPKWFRLSRQCLNPSLGASLPAMILLVRVGPAVQEVPRRVSRATGGLVHHLGIA